MDTIAYISILGYPVHFCLPASYSYFSIRHIKSHNKFLENSIFLMMACLQFLIPPITAFICLFTISRKIVAGGVGGWVLLTFKQIDGHTVSRKLDVLIQSSVFLWGKSKFQLSDLYLSGTDIFVPRKYHFEEVGHVKATWNHLQHRWNRKTDWRKPETNSLLGKPGLYQIR